MASSDLYRRLQRHLDRMPIGFPEAKSGVDIKILEGLFTPEQAEVALALSAIPEAPETVHKRVKHISIEELSRRLDEMAAKGIILAIPAKDGTRYGKMIFAIGIFEQQLRRLTPEFVRDAEQYLHEEFAHAFHSKKTTQMRVVPVNKSIPVERHVTTHDDLIAYVKASPGPFAKLPCICRSGKELLGDPCKQTTVREICLTIGPGARFSADRAGATLISREEMLELIDTADREGLVLQPQNTKEPVFVCCCCGCCCGVLTSAKQLPSPADYFSSNYYAESDPAACQACGTCQSRCQMDAVSLESGEAQVDRSRCIGCALCVSTCPSEAMQLKPREAVKTPPDDMRALYMQILNERYGPFGKAALGIRKLLGMKI